MAGRGTFVRILILLTAAMLLGIPFPAPPSEAGSSWREDATDFANGTLDNVSLGSGALTLGAGGPMPGIWTEMNCPDRPSARESHSMVYDSAHRVFVLFGGRDADGKYLNDLSIYDPGANIWTLKKPANPPSARSRFGLVYDSAHGELVLFGGHETHRDLNDTWSYNLTTNSWTELTPSTGPPANIGFNMAYDSANGETVLFGGYEDMPGARRNQTWAYNLTANTWMNMKPPAAPEGRSHQAMAYDSTHGEVVLFGGNTDYGYLDDTWTYNLSKNIWTFKNPSTGPPAGYGQGMVYDGMHGHMVMFGGFGGSFRGNEWMCSTWTYDLTTNAWTNRTPTDSPPGRCYHAMAYDSGHGEIVLFGGFQNESYLDDVWIYNLFNAHANGTYESIPHDAGGAACFGTMSWNADMPQNTTVRFQFRSADSLENLTIRDFSGPDGTPDSFYSINGQLINSAHNRTRWFQYRACLGTNDLPASPVLRSVTVSYNLIQDVELVFPAGGEDWTGPQNITWSASDKDNDSLAFDLYLENESVKIPLAKNLANDARKWSWNTETIPNGTYWIRITARDDNTSIPLSVEAASGKFTIRHPAPPPPNHLPHVTLVSPLNNSFLSTDAVRLRWLGTDPDGDRLDYSLSCSDDPFAIHTVRSHETVAEYFDLDGLADNTTYFWTVSASDGKGNGTRIHMEIWSFTVKLTPANIPVRFTSTPNTTAWAGKEYTYNLTSIDEDGDIPIFSIVSAPATLTLSPSTGKLRWTPATSDIGNHTITLQVSDGRGGTDNQTFTVSVKEIPSPPVILPKCAITYPANGTTVKGTVQIKGTAINGSLPLSIIKVRIDNGTWTTAIGLSNWSFTLDTTKLAKGPHHIEAKAFAANLSSDPASVDLTVHNPEPGDPSGGNPWCLPAMAIAIVAGIAGFILVKKRGNR